MADFPIYPIQASFARGELSPRLYSRADIEHWKMALKECVNWIVLKQGGLRRRPGTEWINEVKDSSKKVRLLPFVFSTNEAYIIELGHHYARFFANGGMLTGSAVQISGATPTAPHGGVASRINDGDIALRLETNALGDLSVVPLTSRIVAKLNFGSQKAIYSAQAINVASSLNHRGYFQFVTSNDAITWTARGSPFLLTDDYLDVAVNFPGLKQTVLYAGLAAMDEKFGTSALVLGELLTYINSGQEQHVPFEAFMPRGGDETKIADGDTQTQATTDVLGDLTANTLAQRVVAYFDLNAGLAVGVDLMIVRNAKLTGALSMRGRFYTSPDDNVYTAYGSDFEITTDPQTYGRQATATARYIALAIDDVDYDVTKVFLAEMIVYETVDEAPIELVTPWGEEDLFDIQFTQSADIMFMAHPNYRPYEITRSELTTFNLETYDPIDGPYLPENTTTTTMKPDAVSGNVIITASALTGVNDGNGFVATDVGRPISLQYSSKFYWAKILEVTSNLTVVAAVKGLIESDGTVVTDFPGITATGVWRLGAWSESTGWPGSVGFYQERLCWARTDTQRQTIWTTVAGGLKQFQTTVPLQTDDAVTVTILGGEVNEIQWLTEGADLAVGTTGASRTLGPADSSKPFGPENLVQRRQTTFGTRRIQPVLVGNVSIYANYFGTMLREFIFSFQQNAYTSPELTILSEHALRSCVKQMAFSQDPDSIVWLAMGNGELVGVTYERDQQIVAIHRHRLGGSCGDTIIDPYTGMSLSPVPYGMVESVAVIPGDSRSELWLSVKRTINGETKRYVERLTKLFESPMMKEDAIFVDSSYTYEGAASTNFSDISWLEGETVGILADGSVRPTDAVASGAIEIAHAAVKVTFGLPYTSRAKTLGISQGGQDGTILGRKQAVVGAKIDIMETGYLEIKSPNAIKPEIVSYRQQSDVMDTSPALRSGFHHVVFDKSWADFGVVIMQTDKPLPATIRAIEAVFIGEP